uniref:Beta/alpha-defensin C-terminal domain-containing protein n=1 Tax=Catagonus wagneri TaxID=51154 RepID=A0A8C3XC15_9CETA
MALFIFDTVAFIIFFLGLLKGTGNPVSCIGNRGVCIPGNCGPKMKQIGTCGLAKIKCCKKK